MRTPKLPTRAWRKEIGSVLEQEEKQAEEQRCPTPAVVVEAIAREGRVRTQSRRETLKFGVAQAGSHW